ncbi:alpha/beta hydrolase family protein [Sulfuracidifex tepidarius]|uniref:Peptidase S9 prolyl oligopeptidase catalytic domain-containing protein n=1 Tax=Sulfuracidifex tepidarius TaxID=1294262 RepID=A0A510DVB0_9CREN|nr:alpha/beta hydrolase [Sulfuracidifex tepidarius]BBG24166.1 hypothetical protein IC006_1470 [Sulfuracidifex tepidarius]BBG26923.1 hypothetical protein IC007_1447 [Sulfuracidifex tepidarius]
MRCLVLHGKNSSPEKIKWLTDPISKFAEVESPFVDMEVSEIVEKFRHENYECFAGHSRGGTAALILGSIRPSVVIAVSSPTDRKLQLDHLSKFPDDTPQSSLYKDLSKVRDLDSSSPINYVEGLKNSSILLIYGDSDQIVPRRHGEVLCEKLANCRLEIVKGMKHSPMGQQIGQINRIISEFLKYYVNSRRIT